MKNHSTHLSQAQAQAIHRRVGTYPDYPRDGVLFRDAIAGCGDGCLFEAMIDALARELSGILQWIDQLAEVDTDGVEPMTSVVHAKLPMREDVVTDGGDAERVLANAPRRADGFFVVPKVVE